ncbi:MAG: MFS transporter [Pseudonocardiaceae bacterium]|nr:MFS transporter [Pseudonocardiaceae bacterium]
MSSKAPAGSGARAGFREWTGLAVLALPCLLLAVDMNVLHMALPQLSADLNPSSSQLLWIIDMYSFMLAGFLITMGTLGDRIGRRRLLLIGVGAFGIASALAAYSISAEMLIVTRALLGISGAAVMPSTLSLVSALFVNPRQRTVAVSVWMSCFMVGAAIGPVIGGLLLEFFWWGSVFLLGVPVMVAVLLTGRLLLPEYRDTTAGKLDLISVALSLATVMPVIYGLKEIAKDGVHWLPVLAIVAGVAVGVSFVRRQRVLPDPLLDMRLFGNRSFRVILMIMVLGIVAFSGVVLFIPQYLQLVANLSPLWAGMWMTPAVVAMTIVTLLAPLAIRRIAPGHVIGTGLLVAAIGYLVLTQVEAVAGLGVLVVGAIIAYSGTGPMMALGTDLVVGYAPPEKAGSASAIAETGMEFGSAMGVAVLGSIGTAVYRHQVADSIPADVPDEAAAATRDTLPNAAGAAEELPSQLATELLTPARESFSHGLNTAAAISAALLVGLGVLAMTALRRIVPGNGSASHVASGDSTSESMPHSR